MGRDLLLRLLALALVSATLAVSGTVWLTTHDHPADTTLDADNEIRAALHRYAREHPDWSGVAPLIRELADRTDRRIALTTPDGTPVADSAPGAVDPPAPATVIDATALDASLVAPASSSERPMQGGVGFAYRGWRLTPTELAQRDALVDAATRCLQAHAAELAGEPRHRRVSGL
ncbi:MAG TPA: two-component sensor histidine kinase, partial [Yinghuangia sp.]|nr:two-component sensor histidine kinase [Yinghuangia sp.]